MIGLVLAGVAFNGALLGRLRSPSPYPERQVLVWALATALLLGGGAWVVRWQALPVAYGEFAPNTHPEHVRWVLEWLDGQAYGALFGPSYGQWYWPPLVAGAGLLAGGASAALREWSARLAASRDPFDERLRTADAPEPVTRTEKVFLSYSRKDTALARRLVARLEGRVGDVWVDWHGIKPSAQWLEELSEAIRSSDALVVLISPDTLRSPYCWDECKQAIDLGKRVLPVIVSPELAQGTTAALRAAEWDELTAYQYLGMSTPEAFEAGIDAIAAFVSREHDWVAFHTRLGLQAHAWKVNGGSDGLLLRPHEVRIAESWRRNTPVDPDFKGELTPLQEDFIAASGAAMRRRARRGRVGAGAVLGALLALGSLVVSVQTDTAEDRRLALSRALAAASGAAPYPGMQRSLLLSAAAYETAGTNAARSRMAERLLRFNHVARVLATGVDDVGGAAFSRDGSTFAFTLSDPERTQVWDTDRWRPRTTVPGALPKKGSWPCDSPELSLSSGWFTCQDGREERLAQAGWDPGEGKYVAAVSEDGRHALVGMEGEEREREPGWVERVRAEVWDVDERRKLGDVDTEQLRDRGLYIGTAIDDSRLAALVTDPVHGMWLAASKYGVVPSSDPVTPLRGIDNGTKIFHSPDGSKAVTLTEDGTLLAWDTRSGGRLAAETPVPGLAPHQLFNRTALSPDRRTLAVAQGSEVRLLNTTDGSQHGRVRLSGRGDALTFSHNGRRLAVTHTVFNKGEETAQGARGRLVTEIFDVPGGRRTALLRSPHQATLAQVAGIAFTADGRGLFIGETRKSRILEWDVRRQRVARTFTSREVGFLDRMVLSPDGRRLAAVDRQQVVHLWDTASGAHTALPKPAEGALAFTPDSKRLLTAGQEGIRRWRMSDHREETPPLAVGSGRYVRSLRITPDGRHAVLVSADRDTLWEGSVGGDVRLWDLDRQEPVGPVLAKTTGSAAPELTPDGSRAVFAAQGRIVSVAVSPRTWHEELCALTTRPLGRDEWRAVAPQQRYPSVCGRQD
ncbi:toll/interleukin-1 receptor domain-containing protein [Streptomyces sp. NBRC 110611]|uniref:toll/interleukin-1 receptor domain-containing protein n=1 Tax=Streptomyces sp. NBRC 110611 TaxID=1621259 RepID=UPI00099FD427|nr:toll/interleukin-1 receptor domain-containing protein [Streptomyces sp. NBRC 110611]